MLDALNGYLKELRLGESGYGIEPHLMPGHPIATAIATANEAAGDTIFPAIGVEWGRDDDEEQDVGLNFRELRMNDAIRDEIRRHREMSRAIVVEGAGGRLPRDELQRDQVTAHLMERFCDFQGIVESYTSHINSTVLVTGWANDAQADETHLILYRAVNLVIPFIAARLRKLFDVEVYRVGGANLRIENHDVRPIAHGFEITLQLRQLLKVYRHVYDREPIKEFRAHLEEGHGDGIVNVGPPAVPADALNKIPPIMR